MSDQRGQFMRKLIGIGFCLVLPAWFVLSGLETRLLRAGVLNTKDMPPFAGHETGTVAEYLLNIWTWDFVLGAMMIAALPCLVCGFLILLSCRMQC